MPKYLSIALLLLLPSCSVAKKFSLEQCIIDEDCSARGGEFEGSRCLQNVCVSKGSTQVSGSCTSNKECIERFAGQPYICKNEQCLSLLNDQCPAVLSESSLQNDDVTLIGAFSQIESIGPLSATATINYQFALDSFHEKVSGLPEKSGTSRSPIAIVLCQGVSPDLDHSLSHLSGTLEVPAIITPLTSSDLLKAYNNYGSGPTTFFMSPFEADAALINADESGTMWHLLGSGFDMGLPYQILVERAEALIRSRRSLDSSYQIKVALIDNDLNLFRDGADALRELLSFNGKAVDAQAEQFIKLRMISEYTDPTASAADVVTSLLDFKPDLIISLNGGEFMTKVIRSVESGLSTPPFYLLSTYHFGNPATTSAFEDIADLGDRSVGLNFAGAEDRSIYNEYLADIKGTYPKATGLNDTENFYDAAMYLFFAMTWAAKFSTLDGPGIAEGMSHLIDGDEQELRYRNLPAIYASLIQNKDAKMSLSATMGPPDFDLATGTRRGSFTTWCVHSSSGEVASEAMRFSWATEDYSGTLPCFAGFE